MVKKKTSNKPKQQQSKPKQKARSSRVIRTKSVVDMSKHVSLVCGLNDPFCKHAIGARYLDGSKARTVTVPFHNRYAIANDANGNFSYLFCPGFTNLVATATITGTSAVYGTLGSITPFAAATGYRLVSGGVVVRAIGAPLNASGMLRLRSFDAIDGSTLGTIDITTYNCDSYEDVPMNAVKEVACAFKRIDDVKCRQLVSTATTNPNSSVASWISPGWGAIMISVNGGQPSTITLDVEVFLNYEVTFADDNAMSLIAIPTPPQNPIVSEVSQVVSSEAKAFVKEGVRSFGNVIVDSAARALRKALQGAASRAPLLLGA